MRSYTAIYRVGAQSVRQGENHQTRQEKPTDLCEKRVSLNWPHQDTKSLIS